MHENRLFTEIVFAFTDILCDAEHYVQRAVMQ
jgi:hypothetical protein